MRLFPGWYTRVSGVRGAAVRDKTIDGFRAVAALGVVFAHAVGYRFASVQWLHYPQRLADPLAETSVQLFFVISGYIITNLLLQERERTGTISISAFYIRRVCRIIPPLAAYLVAAFSLTAAPSLAMASTFTCNIGSCDWYVAHTWSLSVEEQFYLGWPMLLVIFGTEWLPLAIGTLLIAYLATPTVAHSNLISFSCIGIGAVYASRKVSIPPNTFAWLCVAAFLLIGPLYLPEKIKALTPLLIVYLLFGVPAWAKQILATRPVQMIGGASYSLYLWQQMFLGRDSTAPLWLLPIVVALSVLVVEQPFIRLGRFLTQLRVGQQA
jgi:peptidoglycan/LPS O-acetylase OafA/YrhL